MQRESCWVNRPYILTDMWARYSCSGSPNLAANHFLERPRDTGLAAIKFSVSESPTIYQLRRLMSIYFVVSELRG